MARGKIRIATVAIAIAVAHKRASWVRRIPGENDTFNHWFRILLIIGYVNESSSYQSWNGLLVWWVSWRWGLKFWIVSVMKFLILLHLHIHFFTSFFWHSTKLDCWKKDCWNVWGSRDQESVTHHPWTSQVLSIFSTGSIGIGFYWSGPPGTFCSWGTGSWPQLIGFVERSPATIVVSAMFINWITSHQTTLQPSQVITP